MPTGVLLFALDGARAPVPVSIQDLVGSGSGSIDINALAEAIADKIALKTLNVSGDATDESALATAIANAIALKDLKAIGYTPPVISDSFTRPSDTIAYAQNDLIGNSTSAVTPLTFSVARANGGTGYLNTVLFQTNNPAWTNAQLILWLYRSMPSNIPTDNNPFTLLWANRDNLIGSVSLATFSSGGTGSDSVRCYVSNLGIQFGTLAGSTNIYGLIQNATSGTLTPTSGQGFHVQLRVEQN